MTPHRSPGAGVCDSSPTSAGALIAGHPLPPRLADAADPGVIAWRDEQLPALVEGLLSQWFLRAQAPFTPGGSTAWVAPVRGPDGAEQVLKVAWAHDESRDEAAGMAAWQGHGAARVLHTEQRGQTSLLLMEHVRPGRSLSQSLPWPARDEVIAGLLRSLWSAPIPPGSPFRPLEQMCAWWADEAAGRLAAPSPGGSRGSASPEQSELPADLIEHGLGLFRELPRSWDGESVLLATDLHPENVLLSQTESAAAGQGAGSGMGAGVGAGMGAGVGADVGAGARAGVGADGEDDSTRGCWVLIDPKPYVGDPHYDVLQHMLNDLDRLTADPSAFARRMARLTGLDPRRVQQWLLARCVQETGVIDGAAQAALRLASDGIR